MAFMTSFPPLLNHHSLYCVITAAALRAQHTYDDDDDDDTTSSSAQCVMWAGPWQGAESAFSRFNSSPLEASVTGIHHVLIKQRYLIKSADRITHGQLGAAAPRV